MQFFKSILIFLNKPFPQEESVSGILKVIFLVSLFVTLFLYVFAPFDIDTSNQNHLLLCLGFGAITFIASLIFELISVYVLRLKGEGIDFTFGRWILYMIGVMLCISVANFIYVRLIHFGYIRWEFLPFMIRGTFAIGIFPTIGLGILALYRLERKYQNIASEINQSTPSDVNIDKTSQRQVFDIPIAEIRYVEALQNYVKIGHIHKDGSLVEKTERATLKSILDEVQGSSLVKCHRSFLVNKSAIVSTSGNAQGLLLSLKDCDRAVPVSRSWVSDFRYKM